uniref:Uncharacterized protein n=1 Tax=Setaria italica TaxID=4555 RepID=K3Y4E6_SETIT
MLIASFGRAVSFIIIDHRKKATPKTLFIDTSRASSTAFTFVRH